MAAGRSTDARSITVGTTSGSAALTGGAGTFRASDKGRGITGTGIPVGATISAVASATAATLSANASATGASVSATVAPVAQEGSSLGFFGNSVEDDTEAGGYTVAKVNAGTVTADRVTGPNVPAPYLTRRTV